MRCPATTPRRSHACGGPAGSSFAGVRLALARWRHANIGYHVAGLAMVSWGAPKAVRAGLLLLQTDANLVAISALPTPSAANSTIRARAAQPARIVV